MKFQSHPPNKPVLIIFTEKVEGNVQKVPEVQLVQKVQLVQCCIKLNELIEPFVFLKHFSMVQEKF